MQENMLMELLKVMANIIGLMAAFTKVISVTVQDMGMESGKIKIKLILVLIKWTISKDLEFIHGKIKKFIKASSEMITKMDMEKCILLTD